MTVVGAQSMRFLTERRFFTGMAIAMAVAAFIGFAPTFYLEPWNTAPTPPLTPGIVVHGALNTVWMLLLVLQAGLIATARYDVHKLTGALGVALAAAILVSGLLVAIDSERRVHTAANAGTFNDPYVFLSFPFFSVGTFALFVALGVLNRHRTDVHKRLMLFATMSLVVPALARIARQFTTAIAPPIGGMILMDVFLLLVVVYDIASRGKLHPATLWGGGLLLLTEPLRVAVGLSAPWQAFARMLMG